MSDLQATFDTILDRCNMRELNQSGQYQGHCPAHESRRGNNLTAHLDHDKILIHCYAGCSPESITVALGLSMADLSANRSRDAPRQSQPKPGPIKPAVKQSNQSKTTDYSYHDDQGHEVYIIRRVDKSDGEKFFYPLRRIGGAEVNGLPKTIRRYPYNLMCFKYARQTGETLYFVEGEKCAQRLIDEGILATCVAGGAKAWRPYQHDYARHFTGINVVILPDNDEPGKELANAVKNTIGGCTKSVKIIELPGLKDKEDIVDWLDNEHTIDELRELETEEAVQPAEGLPFNPKLELQLTKDGKVRETLYNYDVILREHPHWHKRLKLNTFTGDSIELDGKPLTDIEEIEMGLWCASQYGIGGNNRHARRDAILAVAKRSAYDPLLEYVRDLPPWDGIQRLSTWLADWCGAQEGNYSAWVGEMILIQMVARALIPGCMARYVPILEGAEQIGKSQLVLALGDPWSQVFDMSMDSKEAHMAVQGCWVAELADLDSLGRSAETRIKSFISQTFDSYIPKYSNNRVIHPRRCVFIGTTNEDCYLGGQTGNTRFFPIVITEIDLDRIKENRVQLLAEAKAYLADNPEWWHMPDYLEGELQEQRDTRRMRSVYEESLRQWVDGEIPSFRTDKRRQDDPQYPYQEQPEAKSRDETTWREIAENFLCIDRPEGWKDRALQMQIASALKAIGWKRKKTSKTYLWVRA